MATTVFSTRTAPPPLPRFWQCLAGYWQLPATEAKHWWRALCRSRRHGPTAWRHAVLLFEARAAPSPESVHAFMAATCTPAQVTDVLEQLVQEGQLPRQTANRLEERLLQRIDRDGRWY